MKTFRQLVLVLCVITSAVTLRGQVAQPKATPPPLPPGPLLQKRAPQISLWIVTTKTGSAKEVDPGNRPDPLQNVVKTAFQKSGEIILVTHLDEKRQQWPVWCMGSLEVIVWPGGKGCDVVAPPPYRDMINPLYTDLSTSDFPGLDWISLDAYVDQTSYKGLTCIVYKKVVNVPADNPALPPTPVPAVAYVDLGTRLPIASLFRDQTTLYEWQTPPQAPLTLPPQVRTLVGNRQRGFDQMAMKAVKPF